ncbi:mechanosensitive ion channel family protein [Bifidobacterium callitrichidarum]|uniref:Transporter n=1 Tax=Bifidobacterium callitrichidarum TaxID=2052941 RepID=A0A2U2N108_9BIFI|nr:mechanosensitive ion channel family protein [Bifidobacterium callitrichidarum]PWG62747.1 transporter [Bifidobacterium callitrichidarum]
MTDFGALMSVWFQTNAGKLIWLLVVAAVAFIADRVVSRVLRKVLDKSEIPSASIFINLTRTVIWVAAAAMVLQPVFGINPTTLVTALGVGGVALSLGLKDTIANVIGGFGLMLGRVIQPGDLVTIQGTTGTVVDITWRHSMIETRSGDRMVIPNSILNTASLTKLTPVSEGTVTLEFTAKASSDPTEVSRKILDCVTKATADVELETQPPLVKFTGFSPYGMTGEVLLFAKPGVLLSTVRDRAARAIAEAGTDYLVEDGGSSDNV